MNSKPMDVWETVEEAPSAEWWTAFDRASITPAVEATVTKEELDSSPPQLTRMEEQVTTAPTQDSSSGMEAQPAFLRDMSPLVADPDAGMESDDSAVEV